MVRDSIVDAVDVISFGTLISLLGVVVGVISSKGISETGKALDEFDDDTYLLNV